MVWVLNFPTSVRLKLKVFPGWGLVVVKASIEEKQIRNVLIHSAHHGVAPCGMGKLMRICSHCSLDLRGVMLLQNPAHQAGGQTARYYDNPDQH